MMIGMLLVCSNDACALYDLRYTNSYVYSLFASHFGKNLILLGESLLVNHTYNFFEIAIVNKKIMANLIVFDILDLM